MIKNREKFKNFFETFFTNPLAFFIYIMYNVKAYRYALKREVATHEVGNFRGVCPIF